MNDFTSVPAELRAAARWVGWTSETVPNRPKPAKRPKIAGTARNADATNPRDWREFDVACSGAAAGVHDGVGLTTGEEEGLGRVVLVDFDGGCFDNEGNPHPRALEWVRRFGSYSEYSPSRRLHILAVVTHGKPLRLRTVTKGTDGRERESWKCRRAIDGLDVEVYDRDRYSTVTGEPFCDPKTGEIYVALADAEEAQKALDGLCDLLWPATATLQHAAVPVTAAGGINARERSLTIPLADHEVVAKLCAERDGGAKWADLLQGAWEAHGYPSPSEADLAICTKLAFYCAGDAAQIERIVSANPCGKRDKWRERPDYRANTIQNAVTSVVTFYGSAPSATKRRQPHGSTPPLGPASAEAAPLYHGISLMPTRLTGGDNGREVEYAVYFEGEPTGSKIRVTPHSKEAVKDAARDVVEDLAERGIKVTIAETASHLRRRILTASRVEIDIRALEAERGIGRTDLKTMCDEGYRAWRELHRPVFRAPTLTRKSAGFQVWCEAHGGGWRYSDALVKIIDDSVAAAVASADDYMPPNRHSPLYPQHKALEVARLTFQGRLLRDLPEEDGETGLGPNSRAAAEMRRLVDDLFLTHFHFRGTEDTGAASIGRSAVSCVLETVDGLRIDLDHQRQGRSTRNRWRGAWTPIQNYGGLLFVAVTDAGADDESVWLGLSHRAFQRASHAAGKSLVACRTIMTRYGLAHTGNDVTQRVRTRSGKRIEIVVLAREVIDHLVLRAEWNGVMGDGAEHRAPGDQEDREGAPSR